MRRAQVTIVSIQRDDPIPGIGVPTMFSHVGDEESSKSAM